MDFLYLIKNVFFAAVLVSLGINPAFAKELPFHKAMVHLTPESMDPMIDDILKGVQDHCFHQPSAPREDIRALYQEMCLLPSLIQRYRDHLASLTTDEKSGVMTPDLTQYPLLKKYHLLKSLAWGKARATVVDPLAFVSEVFVIQVSMVKSLKAFLSLADIWNGKQKDFPLYLYMYPKFAAYLETNTLFGATLAYYENILCDLKEHDRPIARNPCYRYKAQVAGELISAFEAIAPQVEQFIEGIRATSQKIDDKDILRIQQIWSLHEVLQAAKNDSKIRASSLFNEAGVNTSSELYQAIYKTLRTATVQKFTLSDAELVQLYLGVASLLEVASASQTIWSMRAFRKIDGIEKVVPELARTLEAEFEQIHSSVLYFLEAQDGSL